MTPRPPVGSSKWFPSFNFRGRSQELHFSLPFYFSILPSHKSVAFSVFVTAFAPVFSDFFTLRTIFATYQLLSNLAALVIFLSLSDVSYLSHFLPNWSAFSKLSVGRYLDIYKVDKCFMDVLNTIKVTFDHVTTPHFLRNPESNTKLFDYDAMAEG